MPPPLCKWTTGLMTNLIFGAAFAAGLATLGWVGAGYLSGHVLALLVTLLIAAFYLAGALELRRFREATRALGASVQTVIAAGQESMAPPALAAWTATLPPSLRDAVRQRIEGARVGLPGPQMASYLTGLLVLLGMLGTFLGMVVTLHGTGTALLGAEGLAAIRDALSAPVRGLGLAFGTSVAGVGASAALGLMAALARRERGAVAQQLDAAMLGALRPFTPQYQRETSLRLMEQQAQVLPDLVERIGSCMTALERQQAALSERLAADQARFHQGTEAAYTALAASVERALSSSAAESARHAGAAIQPAIEAALSGLARESAQLQAAQAQQVREQLAGIGTQFGDATAAVAGQWTQALEAHRATSETTTRELREALAQFTTQFGDRSQALAADLHQQQAQQAQALTAQWTQTLAQQTQAAQAQATQVEQALQTASGSFAAQAAALRDGVAQAHESLQGRLAAQEQARHDAWVQSLQGVAGTLRDEWQQAGTLAAQHWQHLGAQAVLHWQHLGAELTRTTDQITTRTEAQAAQLLAQIEQRAAQAAEREAAWAASLQGLATTLGAQWQAASAEATAQWQRAGAEATTQWQQLGANLEQTSSAIQAQAEAQATRVLARLDERAAQDAAREAAWSASLHTLSATLHQEWEQASNQARSQWQQLGEVLNGASTSMQAQAQAHASQLLAQIDARAAQDQARQSEWTASLQGLAATLREEWQHASSGATQQWQQLGDVLARAGADMGAQAQSQAQRLLAQMDERAAQDQARQQAWTQSLQALAASLQGEWQQAGAHAAAQWRGLGDTLSHTAQGITQQLQAQASQTLGEIRTLVDAASEAPRAAAEVMGELRQKLSDSMVRDNAMLEERTRILETLSTLLDAVSHASVEQRSAIDALVATTSELMERASGRFADTLDAQSTRLDAVAAQVSGSALEVASLGEAFGAGVQRFGESNEQLVAQLQRIESALAQSLKRSDEQLDYYVAQAREVIELSIGAQKQIIDELQQLATERGAAVTTA